MSMRVCQYCGKEVKQGSAATCHECSTKYMKLWESVFNKQKREKPKHTPEQLEAIRQKYKNGVPAGEVEKWINTL